MKTTILPFISLISNNGPRTNGVGQTWKDGWYKCFDRETLKSEEDVRVGDTGSVGIGYWVHYPLNLLITADDETSVAKILATKPTAGNYHDPHGKKIAAQYSFQCDEVNVPVGKRSIKAVVKFYRISQQPNGTLFGLKRGTKALWIVEKTGDYYFAPWVGESDIALFSKWQRTENYFNHRFPFRVVKVIPLTERNMVHHFELIKNHEVTV
jgi:hypothetical protein